MSGKVRRPSSPWVGFRNLAAHDSSEIDDEAVYAIAQHDVAVLRSECAALLERAGDDARE